MQYYVIDHKYLLYKRLVDANEEAFANHLFSVACHVLSGAMYCALALRDDGKLAEVEQIAYSQLQELSKHSVPPDSTRFSLELSLYTSLVQIVRTWRVLSPIESPTESKGESKA